MADHTGWTCPKCGRVWAPTKDECAVCNGAVQPTVVPYQPVTPMPWYQPYYSPYYPGTAKPWWQEPTITWGNGTTASTFHTGPADE